MESAPADLLVRFDEARQIAVAKEGGTWIYVSVDRVSSEPINAAGFWPTEVDAFLAASSDPDEDSYHVVLPLFVQNRYESPTT